MRLERRVRVRKVQKYYPFAVFLVIQQFGCKAGLRAAMPGAAKGAEAMNDLRVNFANVRFPSGPLSAQFCGVAKAAKRHKFPIGE